MVDTRLRAAAASGLLASASLSTTAIWLPAALRTAVAERQLHSGVGRTLLAAALESPSVVGRHLLWNCRAALAGGPAARARASALAQAYLDALPELATAEAALGAYGVSQLVVAVLGAVAATPTDAATGHLPHAAAPSSSTAAGRAAATASLRRGLATVLLPHTVRLPLAATPPVTPASFYRAAGDGALARATALLVDGGRTLGAVAAVLPPPARAGPPAGERKGRDAPGGVRRRRRGSSSGDDDEDDEEGHEGEGVDASDAAADAMSVLQDIEDDTALALAPLGVFADAVALAIPPALARDARSLATRVRAAGEEEGVGDVAVPVGGVAELAAASRPLAAPHCAAHPALPYPAALLVAARDAGTFGHVHRHGRGSMDVRQPVAGVAAAAWGALTTQLAAAGTPTATALAAALPATFVPPDPAGAALPACGLPVRGLAPAAARVLYLNPRRRAVRVLLAARVASGGDGSGGGDETDAAGAPVAGGNIATAVGRDPHPEVVKVGEALPRPLRFRDNSATVLLSACDDATVATESIHAAAWGTMGAAWRACGLEVGDHAPPAAYGVHYVSGRDERVGGGGGSYMESADCSVGGRTVGFLLVPPGASTLAEVLAVDDDDVGQHDDLRSLPPPLLPSAPLQTDESAGAGGVPAGGEGYGRNGLQRWLMAHLFNSQKPEVRPGSRRSSLGGDEGASGGGGGGGGAYMDIVETYTASLAGVVAATYVLALGRRRPADLLLSPAGHVTLINWGYEEVVPEPALMVDETDPAVALRHVARVADAGFEPPRFAGHRLCNELVSVLSSTGAVAPTPASLVAACVDAVMSLRGSPASDLVAHLASGGAWQLGGFTQPAAACALRSRLLLHLPEEKARVRLSDTFRKFLFVGESAPIAPAPAPVAALALSATLPPPVPSRSVSPAGGGAPPRAAPAVAYATAALAAGGMRRVAAPVASPHVLAAYPSRPDHSPGLTLPSLSGPPPPLPPQAYAGIRLAPGGSGSGGTSGMGARTPGGR